MKPSLPEVVEDYVPSQRMPSKVYSFFLSKGISPKLIDYLFTQPKLEVIVKIKEEIWNRRNSIESEVEDRLLDSCVETLAIQILQGIPKQQLRKARRFKNEGLATRLLGKEYLLSRIEESVLSYLLEYRYNELMRALRTSGSTIELTNSEVQVILAELKEYRPVLSGTDLVYSGSYDVMHIFPGLLASPVNEKDLSQLELVQDADFRLRMVVIYLNLREYLVYKDVPNDLQEQILDGIQNLKVPYINYHLGNIIGKNGYIGIFNKVFKNDPRGYNLQEDIQILDNRLHNALLGNITDYKVLGEINLIADYFMSVKSLLGDWKFAGDEQAIPDYFDAVNQLRLSLNEVFGYEAQGEA